jgi:hypothetical protein
VARLTVSLAVGPTVGVEVGDPALAEALRGHLQARLDAAIGDLPDVPVVTDDDPTAVSGALVLVPVRGRSPAVLLAHVEALEAAGAGGLQLVWSGRPRSAERAVFHVLEAWRGTKRRCPLLLAPDTTPTSFLRRAMRQS